MAAARTSQKSKPPTVSIVQAAKVLGIGRSVAYELAATGQLTEGIPVIQVGHRYRVPTAALERELGTDLGEHLDPPAA